MILEFLFLFVLYLSSINADVVSGEKLNCPITLNACELKIEAEDLSEWNSFIPGLQGDIGSDGKRGPPGLPGQNGVCMTQFTTYEKVDDMDGGLQYGQPDKPADMLCDVPLNEEPYEDNSEIFVNSALKFKVRCESNWTCLILKVPTQKHIKENAFDYSKEKKPFWLSNYYSDKKVFRLQDFYGIQENQLAWLRERSTEIKQTIRYHCQNSYVKTTNSSTLQLLSWSDSLIDSSPTEFNPYYYDLDLEHNNCHESAPKDKFSFTDINLTKGSPTRLPVVDFFIKDIRNEEQKMFVELRELCFRSVSQ